MLDLDHHAPRFSHIGVALTVCLLLHDAPAATAQESPSASADRGKHILRITDDFRRAKGDIDRRSQLVDEAVDLGDIACKRLADELKKDLALVAKRYQADFSRAAIILVRKQNLTVDENRVKELQRTVLQMAAKEDLGKEEILAESEPAIRELESMTFSVAPEDVLADDDKLHAKRATLATMLDLLNKLESASADPSRLPTSNGSLLETNEKNMILMARLLRAADKKILSDNEALSGKIDPEEYAAVAATNRIRILLGLRALAIDLKLGNAAREHSHDMRTEKFFDHESPLPGKKTVEDRARRAGTTGHGENILVGQTKGEDAVHGWFLSPGHHKNLLTPGYRRVGVGRSEDFWTQVFGG